MNENEKSQTIAFLLRIIALGLALVSVIQSARGMLDDATLSALLAIFFELYNIEIKKR